MIEIELLWITPDAEKHIEDAGRTSYLSFDKKTADSSGKFIKMLIGFGHESVIEHACASFRISGISRVTSHQIVRHRLASYTQQSQRYVDEGGFRFVIPHSFDSMNKLLHHSGKTMDVMRMIQEFYQHLVDEGVPKEDARYVIPNACVTQMVMTANFREWRHFIKLRGDKAAQWEIRNVACGVLGILKHQAPNVFADLEVTKDMVVTKKREDIK